MYGVFFRCEMSYLGLLPIALVLVAASAFCLSYVIAVIRGDVSAAFPYIRSVWKMGSKLAL